MGLAPVVLGGYVKVNATVCPTCGVVGDGSPRVIDAVELTVTVTVEDEGEVVVVVPLPLPLLGGVVVVVVTPAVAVTFAVRFVDSTLVAIPCEFVLDTLSLIDPASVVKVTGIKASALPPASVTFALIVELPPRDDTTAGLALATTAVTAADPTAILIAFAAATEAPPEVAMIVAIPDEFPALKRVVARPFTSVCTSAGSTIPRFVENVMWVPLCGGVPAASSTWALMSAVPLKPSALVAVDRVIVEPDGASSGTFSQERAASAT